MPRGQMVVYGTVKKKKPNGGGVEVSFYVLFFFFIPCHYFTHFNFIT
jgi:hypothetical protein